jgi:3-hydroxyisobutyrate dehydrogenase
MASTRDDVTTVSFVGLGNQGAPMAEMILRAGWALTIFARRADVASHFQSLGARVAATLAELAAADLVAVCVANDSQVRDVLFGGPAPIVPAMKPGQIVAVHSTISPHDCRALGQEAARYGVDLLDAPVSGGYDAPYRRELTVMVGGDETAFARARPVFMAYGDPIERMGSIGSGQSTKVINNYIAAALMGLAHDSVAFARAMGISVEKAVDVWCESSAANAKLKRYRELGFERLIPRPERGTAHSLQIMRYNMAIARELAAERGYEAREWDAMVEHTLELIALTADSETRAGLEDP